MNPSRHYLDPNVLVHIKRLLGGLPNVERRLAAKVAYRCSMSAASNLYKGNHAAESIAERVRGCFRKIGMDYRATCVPGAAAYQRAK